MANSFVADVVVDRSVRLLNALLSSKVFNYYGINSVVSSLNDIIGCRYFEDLSLKKVYYIDGCGILMEFSNPYDDVKVLTDMYGVILSCRVYTVFSISIMLQRVLRYKEISGGLVLEHVE